MEMAKNNSNDANTVREEKIKLCIQLLVHASECYNENCIQLSCSKLKLILRHFRECKKRRQENQCSICKQLIALCRFHAKECTDRQCKVPFCEQIRVKLAQQISEKEMEEILHQIELFNIE